MREQDGALDRPATVEIVPCPVVVLRVGGLPSDSLISMGATYSALRDLRLLRSGRGETSVACHALEELLPSLHQSDRVSARALLSVKRAIHNGRTPNPAELASIAPHLDMATQALLHDEIKHQADLARQAELVRRQHGEESLLGFNKALQLLATKDMAQAVRNTNPALAERLTQALNNPESMKRKALTGARISAMRQASRIALKTSPLNIFGVVALGTVRVAGRRLGELIELTGEALVRSSPSLANLDFAAATLLAHPEGLEDTLPLRLNGSLRGVGEVLTWRKIETSPLSFTVRHSQITRSESRSAPFRLLAKLIRPDEIVSRGDLRSRLETLLPSEGSARLDALLAKALETQFLVVDRLFGVHPRQALALMIRHTREPTRTALSDELELLERHAAERRSDHAEASTTKLIRQAGHDVEPGSARPSLFEDAVMADAPFQLNEADVRELSEDLAAAIRLAGELQPNSLLERTRRFLLRRFKETHGIAGTAADALEFLTQASDKMEEYFSGTSDEEVESLADDRHPAELVRSLLAPDAPVVEWSRAEVLIKLSRQGPRSTSQMCFVQPYFDNRRQLRFALNRCYAGWASTFSRFLPPEGETIDGLRRYLTDISEPGGPVEILGWFGFNACDHPPVVQRTVSVPPIDASGSDERLSSFSLRHRPEWDDLVFVSPEGQEVTVTFTSVLAVGMMPRVHSFARMLGAHTESYAEVWRPFLDHAVRDPNGVLHLPRINIGQVTIVRRQVLLAKGELVSDLDEFEYFGWFNDLMDAWRMPRFIYAGRVEGVEDRALPSRRWKPQFVDRHSPALVTTMRREVARHDGQVQLVEALPEPTDVQVRHNGAPVFAELGVEVTQCRR